MKNTFKGLIAGALIILASTGYAKVGDDYFKIRVVDNKMFTLSVENVLGTAELTIFDESGKTIYSSKEVNDGQLKKKFDLSELPSGAYKFQFRDEFKVRTVSMVISDQLDFDLEDAKVQFIPVITQKGNFVNVSLLSENKDQMTVQIYDNHSNLLFRDVIEGNSYFGRRIDFSKVRRGNYLVVINANGQSVSKNIRI